MDPQNQASAGGGTVTYTISVNYDPGEVLASPLPTILLVTDPIAGLTTSFSPETHVLIQFTSTMTVQIAPSIQPGSYTIHVYAHPDPNSPFPGPDDKEVDVGLVVLSGPATLANTDWALSDLTISPSPPDLGDDIQIFADLTALSTNAPYPQSVQSGCWVDNLPPLPPWGGTPKYSGPTGTPMLLQFDFSSWTQYQTAGTHQVTCLVDPTSEYNDPDRSNNKVSLTFTFLAKFDFNLALSPSSQSINPGGTANYMILLTYSDPRYSKGTTVDIQLTGLGPGMDYHLSQNGALAITTSPSTPAGTYTFTIVGTALGVTHQTSGTLTVTQQSVTMTTTASTSSMPSVPFEYSVSISPSTQSVEIGRITSYVVTVSPKSGNPVSVSLTLEGLPSDIQSSFTMPSGNPPYTSTLNLDLSTSTASAGTYVLTVIATAGGNVKTATVTLIIQEKSSQTETTTATQLGNILSYPTNLAIILIAVIGIGLVAFSARRKRSSVQYTPRPQPSATQSAVNYCANCGAPLKPGKPFCASCGERA